MAVKTPTAAADPEGAYSETEDSNGAEEQAFSAKEPDALVCKGYDASRSKSWFQLAATWSAEGGK
jgi:hypothetical protein